MKIVQISYYKLLRHVRDKKSMSQMILLPIILIFILGTALSNHFTITDISPTKVAYFSQDAGAGSRYFEMFMKSGEVNQIIDLQEVDSYDTGIAMIEKREMTAFVYIDEDYSHGVYQGKQADIQVFSSVQGSFRTSIVQSVVDSYINGANTVQAKIRLNNGEEMDLIHYLGDNEQMFFTKNENIENISIDTAGSTPKAMDYYAVTMLVMILMYGAEYGSGAIAEIKFQSKGSRLIAAPIRRYEIYIGSTLGVALTLFIQSVVLILFTKYVYHVNWGDNLYIILFTCLTLSIFATGLGIVGCLLSGSSKVASSVTNILVVIFTFVAGGYMPLDQQGGLLGIMRGLSPNHYAQRAIFNTIYSGNMEQVKSSIGIMWLMILAVFTISIVKGRRKVI
ncbi:ABC-2 type transporter [Alkaliphilus metalliredigens QYMF]|uniref:ABC-2 type transporter n=1 Tax=Alkaliphilus metalliredigens (strain QYMF) TaxID=293826 RepID=A6TVR7_ALKMQ|nr:ABC transporter permease [Alkaliphilus metalliredigens]ABR50285.1 ABC-2 type transporter [Alkaliphilus metalliredigens QYMF]